MGGELGMNSMNAIRVSCCLRSLLVRRMGVGEN